MANYVKEAKKLKIRPQSFDDLDSIVVKGDWKDLKRVKHVLTCVIEEFEAIFEKQGIRLYYDDIDPNEPMIYWKYA